ncbi:MAG: cupin domain-containing protein [Defluviitaleaceae bacterium]|nr:cupin domain-containing protein [Defluviitaleaceae bacterium]
MYKSDYGPHAFTVDIIKATLNNNNFRTALWTGQHLQLTLMTIPTNEDIGLEVHPHVDQFLFAAEGQGIVQMGEHKENLATQCPIFCNYAILVPAGTWHNIVNTGNRPLKLFSLYAPPNHAHGTIHRTKAIAELEEHNH